MPAAAEKTTEPTRKAEPASVAAYRALERMIVTLALPPSAAVSEGELTERSGFGRTPVREALQRLAWEGLVDIRPRSGIVIAPINPSDWLKVIDARRGVEIILARSAARFLSRDAAHRFHDVALAMRKAAIMSNVMAFLDADRRFDEALSEAADNNFAARFAEPLQTHSRRFWFRYQSEDGLATSTEHHLAIIAAIADGDVDGAEQAAGRLMDVLRGYAEKLALA